MAKDKGVLDRGVRWTPEARAEVWSWRGAVNPEFEREDLETMRKPSVAFAERVRQIGYDWARTRPWFEAGLRRVDPALRPLMEAAMAAAKVKKLPAEPLDIDTEAALVGLDIFACFYGVRVWIAKEGLAFALRALVRCHDFWTSGDEHGYGKEGVWLMCDRSREGHLPEYAESAWRTLRAAVAVADDATYAALLPVADSLRKASPAPVVRGLIAGAFSTERAWADEAADAVVAQGKAASGWSRDLVTVASLDRGVALASLTHWRLEDGHLLTLLARDGAAAAPVVIAALGAASNNEERKGQAKVLAMIETDEVARAFAEWIANKAVSPIAMKYFKRVPEISRRALAPIAAGTGTHARGAKIVLASLGK